MASITTLSEIVQHVHTCMCSALTETALEIDGHPGCPCRSGLTPGSAPLICCPDNCGHTGGTEPGQLTVHVARMYRSSVFPQQDITVVPCKSGFLVAEIVVTLVRCVPVPGPGPRFDLPSMDAQTTAAERQFIDMMSMEQATTCCVPNWVGRRRALRVAVLDHRTIGPTGPNGPGGEKANCAGSELHLAVDVGTVCCPDPVS